MVKCIILHYYLISYHVWNSFIIVTLKNYINFNLLFVDNIKLQYITIKFYIFNNYFVLKIYLFETCFE